MPPPLLTPSPRRPPRGGATAAAAATATATATATPILRRKTGRVPRVALTVLIVFVTCFVYYVEFLWQHRQTLVHTRSFWEESRRHQQERQRQRHGRVGQGQRGGDGVTSPGTMTTTTTTALRRPPAEKEGKPLLPQQQQQQQQQRQPPPPPPPPSEDPEDVQPSSAEQEDRDEPQPPEDEQRQERAADEEEEEEEEDTRDEPQEEQQEEETEEQEQQQETEEETEEERLKRGIPITPNELDELTMERKRLAQNFTRFRLPPLETILDEEGHVIGNPQQVLDFAIIGFGKCGTTSAMHLLRSHSQLQSLQSEMWALFNGDVARFVYRMYEKLDLALPRGYKCPGDIFSPNSLNLFRDQFPATKLIIGVRHPVPWFQSLYNFRVQNFDSYESIPPPNDMIGLCTKQMLMSCTQRGNFGHFLMKLGKQQYLWNEKRHPEYVQDDQDGRGEKGRRDDSAPAPYRLVPNTLEHNLSHWYDKFGDRRWSYERWDSRVFQNPVPNPVFLFELNQLGSSDANATRTREFRRDLAAFLDVSPDGFHPEPERVSPGKMFDEETQRKKDARKINICDEAHRQVRNELMAQSRATSLWIRNVFLKSPGVYSSSTNDHLEELFEKWMHDPCDDRDGARSKTAQSGTRTATT